MAKNIKKNTYHAYQREFNFLQNKTNKKKLPCRSLFYVPDRVRNSFVSMAAAVVVEKVEQQFLLLQLLLLLWIRRHSKNTTPARSPPSFMLQFPVPLPRSNGNVNPKMIFACFALCCDRFPLSKGNASTLARVPLFLLLLLLQLPSPSSASPSTTGNGPLSANSPVGSST